MRITEIITERKKRKRRRAGPRYYVGGWYGWGSGRGGIPDPAPGEPSDGGDMGGGGEG
jgi:hypothetical protein